MAFVRWKLPTLQPPPMPPGVGHRGRQVQLDFRLGASEIAGHLPYCTWATTIPGDQLGSQSTVHGPVSAWISIITWHVLLFRSGGGVLGAAGARSIPPVPGPALSSGHSASSPSLDTALWLRLLPATGRVQNIHVAGLTEHLYERRPGLASRQRQCDYQTKLLNVVQP